MPSLASHLQIRVAAGLFLPECEAMGEDTPSADLALREIDETRQGGSGGTGKPDALGHGVSLSLADGSGTRVALDANW